MELKINITKTKMIWIILAIVLIGFVIAAEIGEPSQVFSAEEKEVLDVIINKEIRKDNPPNITQEKLDIIMNEYGLDKITINFTSAILGNGSANCRGGKCLWNVCTNFREDCFLFSRDYEGETELSILESAEKRIIDNEIRKLTADEPFFWRGFKTKEVVAE